VGGFELLANNKHMEGCFITRKFKDYSKRNWRALSGFRAQNIQNQTYGNLEIFSK
jgi:hypothetical protein